MVKANLQMEEQCEEQACGDEPVLGLTVFMGVTYNPSISLDLPRMFSYCEQ